MDKYQLECDLIEWENELKELEEELAVLSDPDKNSDPELFDNDEDSYIQAIAEAKRNIALLEARLSPPNKRLNESRNEAGLLIA